MIVFAPIIIPLIFIILSLSLGKASGAVQRIVFMAGNVTTIGVAVTILRRVLNEGYLVAQAGAWEAPYGITMVADTFSGIMLTLTSLTVGVVSLYSMAWREDKLNKPVFFALIFGLQMGMNGAFIAGDLFNLYVWFEVMLISSFVLISYGSKKIQLKGTLKYVTMNLVSSFFFVAGIAVLYSAVGTLNMADLAYRVREANGELNLFAPSALILMGFAVKSAIFPFFFWLPDSYHTPPLPVTALFSGTLTKVGVYSMIRFYSLIHLPGDVFYTQLFLFIASTTMISGVLMATSQFEVRRLLSFHIVSQIGYMIMGLGLFTRLALTGAIFYIIGHCIVKTNLFLLSGIGYKITGTFNLKQSGGLMKHKPFIAILFFISALALVGIPPLSGFFGKFMLIKGGVESHEFIHVASALGVSFLTLFSMLKIWNEAYAKDIPEDSQTQDFQFGKAPKQLVISSVILVVVTLSLTFGSKFIIDICDTAANQLLDIDGYIRVILNR
ncbi:proton-conducting transporter membrane subunit [Prolixibacteraceae bacterium Z1-6]|uniref:Proton-conducting transporter membrane subunit n=1 Tax=Draconibacterium aestuarii TaxID=2998507 RepID=A0A9X3F345_9BACT|nr:proton-conducting transporter membrane subunit [Prolixibacteraceae bacterium Z1-6]